MKKIGFVFVILCASTAACVDSDEDTSGGELTENSNEQAILFTGRRGGVSDLYVKYPDGRTVNLTDNPAGDNWGVWSPDGNAIAFQARRDGNTEVYVMAADGSQPRNLSNDPAHDGLPVWSPDGNRIAFFSSRGLEQNDRGLPGHIYVVTTGVQGLRQVTKEPLESTLGPSSWSLDGRYVYFVRLNDAAGTRIMRMHVDTGEEEVVFRSETFLGGAVLSPDESLFAVYEDSGEESRIALVSLAGSDPRVQYVSPEEVRHYYPRWSSDGRSIIYTAMASDGGTFDIEAIDIATKRVRKLIATPESEIEASWRPGQHD